VPIPSGSFKTNVVSERHFIVENPDPTNDEENSAHEHMGPMEPCGHIEVGRVNPAFEGKGSMHVFKHLNAGENKPEPDRDAESLKHTFAIIFEQSMMGPGDGGSRQKKNERVEIR
jgi:hypothetical protein